MKLILKNFNYIFIKKKYCFNFNEKKLNQVFYVWLWMKAAKYLMGNKSFSVDLQTVDMMG